MTPFNLLLYSALFICVAGLGYRIVGWFVCKVGIYGKEASVSLRIVTALKRFLLAFVSRDVLKWLLAIIVDVIFQRRLLVKAGFFRWLAHLLIFYGFLLLLFMHALDAFITLPLFPDYYSTLNPFLFLRSLFGTMVLVGLAIAIGRRIFSPSVNVKTTPMDAYSIFIVAFIIFSGLLLEGFSMTSHSEFNRMLTDYAGLDDANDIAALETYWVTNNALVAPSVQFPIDEELLTEGEDVHDTYCIDCHVSNKWGYLGYGVAKGIRPVASWLDHHSGNTVLWYIHIIGCFFGLALIPFTKMFHIISVPINMMVRAVRDSERGWAENTATIQAIEIDACTHCGVCTQNCSAAMMYAASGNEYILPSEKMRALQKLMHGGKLDPRGKEAVSQGIYACTSCERCTVACPSGIRLKDFWVSAREGLIQSHVPAAGVLSPFSFARGISRKTFPGNYESPVATALHQVCKNGHPMEQLPSPLVLTAKKTDTGIFQTGQQKGVFESDFSACFDCRNCTLICPVVTSCENPEETLGMLPHQIMFSLGLNLLDEASQSAMIWYCLTCYQCQEHCPQKVPVCEHLYSLKNYAATQAKESPAI